MAFKLNTADQTEFARLAALHAADGEFSAEEHLKYRDWLLAQWEDSKSVLEVAKAAEMEQRKKVVSFAFDPNKEKGTERIPLENGYELKAVKKINYNVNQETVNNVLDKFESVSPENKFVAERLIKWEAALSVSEYNNLTEAQKKIIDECITTSDGAPTLEIVAPKGSKRK
jgi:hypothetical protein